MRAAMNLLSRSEENLQVISVLDNRIDAAVAIEFKDAMRASNIMQQRVRNTPNIEIHWNTETKDIVGEESIEKVILKDTKTAEERDLKVSGFFVAIGHKPNTDIFKDQITMDSSGYLLTEPGSTKTNMEGVFACGDAQDNVYRQAVTAAGTGCMAALDAEKFLAEMEDEGEAVAAE